MKNIVFKEMIVWLIVLSGIVIFFAFAYVIGANKDNIFNTIVTYKTLLTESTGIFTGTKVTIHGRSTGNVVKTTLLPEGKVEIVFTVQKHHVFGITKSSIVQLKNAGALGDRFINIFTEDMSAEPLKKGAFIPYQKSSTLLSLLMEDEEQTKKTLQSLITELDEILKKLNKKGVTGLLSNNTQNDDLTQVLKSAKTILKRIESGQGTLGALINDRSVYNRLLVLLGQRPSNNYLKDLSQKSGQ